MASGLPAPRRPGVLPGDISEAGGVWSNRFAHLTAARPRSLPASQDGPWGEGDEDPAPAEPGGSHGPPGAQPQPGPLVQTCLLRDLEMGPLAQTQTLRDFEQVRPRGAGTPAMAPPSPPPPPPAPLGTCRIHVGSPGCTSGVRRAGGGRRASGGGTGRGGSAPPRAPRSPSPPSWLRRAGAAGARVSPPSRPRRPRSGDSSNSSGR